MLKKTILLSSFISAQLVYANLTLTMGGDVNFNKNLFSVNANGFSRDGYVTNWTELTKNLKPLINGDLNFANIETVVTDRNDLSAQGKTYVFRTHPNAIQNLIGLGFNLFNLANNHAFDFGREGMSETLDQMRILKQKNPQVEYFGIGYKHDLLKPVVFQKNGYTIAIASLSIGDTNFVATTNEPGFIHVWNRSQYNEIIKNFKKTSADYKILSIHFGKEGKITLDEGQRAYYEFAVKKGDIDLIIGHHPHAVRPIQKIGDKYIFYSLGNYLMLGSANVTGFGNGKDYGLFSKLHLVRGPTGRLKPEAIELIALTNTHFAAKPLPARTGYEKLLALRNLNKAELGGEAFNYRLNSEGHGIYCESQLQLQSSQLACGVE